jgi:hypothetical protein
MTDRQARELNLRLLHKPRYFWHVDLSALEFNLYRAEGAHVMKFNQADREWYPVRRQVDRDQVLIHDEPITRDQAAKIAMEILV